MEKIDRRIPDVGVGASLEFYRKILMDEGLEKIDEIVDWINKEEKKNSLKRGNT